MDSRIREILKEARAALSCGSANKTALQDFLVAAKIDALLTAEPEPCEDAKVVAENLAFDLSISGMTIDTIQHHMASYASQVADKRAEELRSKIGCALDVALHFKVTDTSDDTISAYHKWRENTLDFLLSAREPKP